MTAISAQDRRIRGQYPRLPPKERSACHCFPSRGSQASHRHLQSQSEPGEVRSLSTRNTVRNRDTRKERSTIYQRPSCLGHFDWSSQRVHTSLAFPRFLPLSRFQNSVTLCGVKHMLHRFAGLLVDVGNADILTRFAKHSELPVIQTVHTERRALPAGDREQRKVIRGLTGLCGATRPAHRARGKSGILRRSL